MSVIETDLKLLLDCIKCQLDSPGAVSQALFTIASICDQQAHGGTFLRKFGGLNFMTDLLVCGGQPTSVQEALMYCLGCSVQNNIYSQQELSKGTLFHLLHDLLASSNKPKKLIQTSVFLITCIVSNNALGQNMARKSGCLQKLIHLFRTTWSDDLVEKTDLSSWFAVTSALNVCSNNPQNDENQRLCVSVLPHALHIMEDNSSAKVIQAVALLIGMMSSQNVYNQARIRHCGCIKMLTSALHRCVNHILDNDEQVAAAVAVCSALNNIMADNEANTAAVCEAGCVQLFLCLLDSPQLRSEDCLQVILSLSHCVDKKGEGSQQMMELGGINILIRLLSASTNEELSSAIKYILQACVGSSPNKPSQSPLKQPGHDDIRHKLDQIERKLTDSLATSQSGLYPSNVNINNTAHEITRALTSSNPNTVSAPPLTKPALYPPRLSEETALYTDTMKRFILNQAELLQRPQTGEEVTLLNIAESDTESHLSYAHTSNQQRQEERSRRTLTQFTVKAKSKESCDVSTKTDLEQAVNALQKERKTRQQLEKDLKDAQKLLSQQKTIVRQSGKAEALLAEVQRQSEQDHNSPTTSCKSSDDILIMRQNELEEKLKQVNAKIYELQKSSTERWVQQSDDDRQSITASDIPSDNNNHHIEDRNEDVRSECSSIVRLDHVTDGSYGNKLVTTGKVISHSDSNPRTPVRNGIKAPCRTKESLNNIDDEVFKVPSTPKKRKRTLSVKSSSLQKDLYTSPALKQRIQPRRNQPNVPASPSTTSLVSDAASVRETPPSPCCSEFDLHLLRSTKQSHFIESNHRSDSDLTIDSQQVSHISSVGSKPKKSLSTSPKPCPGCRPAADLGISPLNSINYNIALETCPDTCLLHKALRHCERKHIYSIKQSTKLSTTTRRPLEALNVLRNEGLNERSKVKRKEDVYDMSCCSDIEEVKRVTPPCSPIRSNLSEHALSVVLRGNCSRRPRVPYSDLEKSYILEGVCKFGRYWTQILNSYSFHPSRTAVDLKDKYKRMKQAESAGSSKSVTLPKASRSFSMVEERRLKRGVRLYGFNWKAILSAFTFSKYRTATELREKWRTLHKMPNFS